MSRKRPSWTVLVRTTPPASVGLPSFTPGLLGDLVIRQVANPHFIASGSA